MPQAARIIKRPWLEPLLREPRSKSMQDINVSDSSTELVNARLGTVPLIGTTLNERYRIESLIAAGGMGRVYLGRHTTLLQPVAIKLLHSHLLTSPQAAERFFKEARAASNLRHPAIASVSDYGESESGEPYIVMDYIPGQPLSQKLQESGTLNAADCVRIAMSVLSALNCCHAQNIIHRDLKPSNIILTDNPDDPFPAKLVDFGIAKLAREEGEAGRVTATGEIFGSPYYMSPEQCQSNQIDGRTDIYALGCVLYECISGKPPFSGRNLIEILMRQCSESAPPLLDLAPDCPKYLSDIIHAMLEKSPEDRPATAEQVLSMIEKAEKLKGKTTPVLISKAEKNKSDARAKTQSRVKQNAITSSITRLSLLLSKWHLLPDPNTSPETQTSNETRVKIALGLTAVVITGSAAWLLPGTFSKPPDPQIDFMVRTLPPSAAQVDEVDVLIERADTERMNGEFFESRQSFDMAEEKCAYLNTYPANALNDRAALIKIGQALCKLRVKDLPDLHVSPVFGSFELNEERLANMQQARALLEQAVQYADKANTGITKIEIEDTVPKLGQKLKTTARIYLAAVQLLANDIAGAHQTFVIADNMVKEQSPVLNDCEADLLREIGAELLWQHGKYLEAGRFYGQAPFIAGAEGYAEPDNNFGGKYINANHDYKLTLHTDEVKSAPSIAHQPQQITAQKALTAISGSWQDLTLAAPLDKPVPVTGSGYDRFATIELTEPGLKVATKTNYIALHMGNTLILKTQGVYVPSDKSMPCRSLIIMQNVKH